LADVVCEYSGKAVMVKRGGSVSDGFMEDEEEGQGAVDEDDERGDVGDVTEGGRSDSKSESAV